MNNPIDNSVVEHPSELTTEWLTAALGRGTVVAFEYKPVGTGQVSDCYRLTLDYAPGDTGPGSVVLKVAAADPTSRQTAAMMGLYESEVRFYKEIVPQLTGTSIAPCYYAAIDAETGVFDLIIGDAAPAVPGDEIRGAGLDQATIAVRELGRLHSTVAGVPELVEVDWLDRGSMITQELFQQLYAIFAERYSTVITAEQKVVCDAIAANFDEYIEMANADQSGLVHGDYRLDNMLFGEVDSDNALTIVDWQGAMRGPGISDLSYFIGGALHTPDRRTHYDHLLQTYHEALGPDSQVTLEDVRQQVRVQSFKGVIMSIAASISVVQTERGDHLFMTTLARHCDHVLDTDALEALPGAKAFG
ncbi:phosphotransferase [Nocardia sp. 348MFTsu5.1]|uniref:phosphotransferase n=1 Tax=Nocardia sp. 348MFTsu5.1 TaxID=1172185 RepID=UPI0005690F5A|nr:phosphotransferase [Nocardia sp. 348MFTsu5.1]